MEKLKAKHDHKLTDILKVAIFAILLIMPFLTYAPTALYYGVNEYATNDTTTVVNVNYKYQSNEVNSVDDLVVGNIYKVKSSNFYIEDFIGSYGYLTGYLLSDIDTNTNLVFEEGISQIKLSKNIFVNIIYDEGGIIDVYTSKQQWNEGDYNVEYSFNGTFKNDFIIQIEAYQLSSTIINWFTYTDYNEIESVDVQENVEQTISQQMYKSWQRMWETPMYNWTNNSILKTGLDNFTGIFGVNSQSYITNLITYELIIVTIYIVIDIVLTLFKWLTHMVGSKE